MVSRVLHRLVLPQTEMATALPRTNSQLAISARNGDSVNDPIIQGFEQSKEKFNLVVTKAMQDAHDRCKARVKQIVKDCKRRNRRFRYTRCQVAIVHAFISM